MRLALSLILSACLLMVGAVAIGRAIDHAERQYVIFTRNGVTLECERITDITGRTFYDSCTRIP